MTDLRARMEAVRDSLAAACPARVVTRRWQPTPNVEQAHLLQGVYCIVSKGEQGYANYNGREALDGDHAMMLICRIQLDEGAAGDAVEDAEFTMVGEVKAWLQALPAALCCLVATGFAQSGQLEAPYGWVAFALTLQGDE